jgi:hypothetical protein
MSEAIATFRDVSLFPASKDDERTCTRLPDVVPSAASDLGSLRTQTAPQLARMAIAARGQLDTVSGEMLVLDYARAAAARVVCTPRTKEAFVCVLLDVHGTPTSAWEPGQAHSRAKPEPVLRRTHVAGREQTAIPSRRGEMLLQRARVAAAAEVKSHLDAGREVYGRRNGKPVVIKPKR